MKQYILLAGLAVAFSHGAAAQHTGPEEPFPLSNPVEHVVITDIFTHTTADHSLPRNGLFSSVQEGRLLYQGNVKNYKLHGNWQSWYLNSQPLDSGKLVNGIPDGEWKLWDSSGNLIAIRHYEANKLQRVKEEMRVNHPKNWHYPLTGLYKQEGRTAMKYLQPGYSFSFAAKQNVPVKKAVQINSTGTVYYPVFKECLHDGLYINYFSNGMVKDSGYYKNGLKEGAWEHHMNSRTFWKATYKNGKPSGEWKEYLLNGQLVQLIHFDTNGKETWRKRYEK